MMLKTVVKMMDMMTDIKILKSLIKNIMEHIVHYIKKNMIKTIKLV